MTRVRLKVRNADGSVSDQPPGLQLDDAGVSRASKRGAELLAAGEFQEALKYYALVLANEPDHRNANLALAGLLTKLGEQEKAQRFLGDFFERAPLSSAPKSSGREQPLVIKLRGFSGTVPTLGKRRNGTWKRKQRGGHFTTMHLLRDPAFAMQTFTISGDNLQNGLMPENDLLLNTIAEPDIENRSLQKLAEYLENVPGAVVINRPEQILQTTRDRNWQRLSDFPGVIFPVTKRLSFNQANRDEVQSKISSAGIDFPIIFRRTGTQTGRTTTLIRTGADITVPEDGGLSGEFYAIAYREILWRGEYFRKLRLFQIDGEFYPVVCHLDRVWNVHGGNRKEIMRGNEALMAEEKRFLQDWRDYVGVENVDHLNRLAEFVGLEFFGVDFTLTDDGQIFIYELNAAMRHSFDHGQNFPYKLPYDEAISSAFEAMVDRRLPSAHAG